MDCPVCRQTLQPFRWKRISLDICTRCNGIWFDYGMLHELETSESLEKVDALFPDDRHNPEKQRAVVAQLGDEPRLCPVDKLEMRRYEWNTGSGVVMDSCGTCEGIWLDSGELEKFVEYVKKFRSGPPKLTPEMKAQLDAINRQSRQSYEEVLDNATRKTIRWDLGFLDDILRELVKLVIR